MQYCEVNKQHPLKADQVWFFRFLTYITMHYSASSVKVAASAVVVLVEAARAKAAAAAMAATKATA